jgi:hypothetical protein
MKASSRKVADFSDKDDAVKMNKEMNRASGIEPRP